MIHNRIAVPFFLTLLFLCMFTSSHADSLKQSEQGTEVSDELKNIAIKIVTSLNQRDHARFHSLLNVSELGRRAIQGIIDNKKMQEGFVSGVEKGGAQLAQRITDSLERSNGTVRFMKFVQRGKEIRPLIRFNLGDSGFDYVEYIVEPDEDGHYEVVDWYQMTTGNNFSETIGSISRLMIDPNPGLLKKLFKIEDFDEGLIDKIRGIGKAMRETDYQAALSHYNSMPENIRTSRIMLLMGVNIANGLKDDDMYKKRLQELALHHADDPSTAFMLLDHYFYEKDIENANRSIDVMENRVGQDGLTTMLRANLYTLIEDYEQMQRHAAEAITVEPEFGDAYFSLALASIKLGKYDQAVEAYNVLESEFGYLFEKQNFEEDEQFSDFVQSNEFRQWMN